MAGLKVWARRPFQYGPLALAQGEVFELMGAPNDEVLLRLRFVQEVVKSNRLHEHGTTGRKFIEAGYLDAFGRAHDRAQEDLSIAEAGMGLHGFVDTTGEAELRRLNQEAPLDLEKTRASHGAL